MVKYIALRDLRVNGKVVKEGKEVIGIKERNLKALINTGRIKVEEIGEVIKVGGVESIEELKSDKNKSNVKKKEDKKMVKEDDLEL